jgi:hypothetical protein
MFVLAIGELPDSWYQVLLAPLFFVVVGAIIWVTGRNAQLKDNAKPWKWFAALPLFLAMVYGWAPFWRVRDGFYRAAIEPFGKKMQMAHYAAFLVPFVCVAALAAWEFYDQKRDAQEDR